MNVKVYNPTGQFLFPGLTGMEHILIFTLLKREILFTCKTKENLLSR